MANRGGTFFVLACYYVGLLIIWIRTSDSVEVTLLDSYSRGGQRLVWHYLQTAGSEKWTEYSSDNLKPNIRGFQVCALSIANQQAWVISPFIRPQGAKRLQVEIKFTVRSCRRYPDPEKLKTCKETFRLYSYEPESDSISDNTGFELEDIEQFKSLEVIAPDKTFVDNVDSVNAVNTKKIQVPLNYGSHGVFLAFSDNGACVAIQSLRVFYELCPTTIANLASFPNTSTGISSEVLVEVQGTCVENAVLDQREPRYLCKVNGEWDVLQGTCTCKSGYQENLARTQCNACPVGQYKWSTIQLSCSDCPENSMSSHSASVMCDCNQGYFRAPSDDHSFPCTKPPSDVRNLSVTHVDQNTVNLTWLYPADFGGRRELWYNLECVNCGPGVQYRPRKNGFNNTSASITDLSPNTRYEIIVTAENSVSIVSRVIRSQRIYVTTLEPLPLQVTNVHLMSMGNSYIALAWDQPLDAGPNRFELFEVVYHPVGSKNKTRITVSTLGINISGLAYDTEYSFEVRGQMVGTWGLFSDPFIATTGQSTLTQLNVHSGDNSVAIIVGSAVAVFLCMSIVIFMVILFLKRCMKKSQLYRGYMPPGRNHRACNEKNSSDCDTLQYSNAMAPHFIETAAVLSKGGGLTVPLFTPGGAFKTYVDPHTYEDPNQAVREFAKEIDALLITIESVIGGGEFGDVCKGHLRMGEGRDDLTVAIKTLKPGASDKNRLDFLTEASIMGQFDDPNVIYLEGVVTKSSPIMIVTEYMENGSLDVFLRNNDGQFTLLQLVGMLRGIASGMNYLADMGYVHRDLAARNILVNERLVCKVADFGLSREIESDDTEGAYTTKGGKIPVRWTAPEAIAYRKFTSASDVWSYGVVMWEVISYSERPYWNWSNHDVIANVDKGFRLPPPMDCPETIYQLMLDCWQKERSQRPKFADIVKTLDKLIRTPESLRKLAKPRPYPYASDAEVATSYETVMEWLSGIKMERYSSVFEEAGYQSTEQVSQLTLKDLINLGITLVGHQKKIMNSIQTMRVRMSPNQQLPEGYLV